MSAKIINDPHHSFSIELATRYGILEAIFINHILYWVNFNKRLKNMIHEGKTWMYQTIEEMGAHFPYLSFDQIYRIIQKLFKQGIILKGHFHKNKSIRTCWYTIADENLVNPSPGISRNREMVDIAKSQNEPSCENAKWLEDTKEKYSKEQQQPAKPAEKGASAPVVVFSCLDQIKGITPSHKEWLSKTYPEQVVKDAVATTKHPETQIKTTEVQMVTYACKERLKPPIDKLEVAKENKPYAQAIEKLVPKSSQAQVSACNDKVEVYYTAGQVLPDVIKYENQNFKSLFHNALEKFGLKYLTKGNL